MTVPNLAESDTVLEAWYDAVTTGINTVGPVSWTPDADMFRQNGATIAITSARCWYVAQDNGLLIVHLAASVNGVGGAGTAMDWKLPIPLLDAADCGGTMHYLDNGTAYRSGTIRGETTTRVRGYIDNQAAAFGVLPNIAAAVADTFRVTVHGRWA
jgi:hypothetical protein